MKGLVFKELIGMVEKSFGDEMAEKIISQANVGSGGAYTSVGTYDYREILSIVGQLSKETKSPIGRLVKAFGKYLVPVFLKKFPIFFNHQSTISFLKSIDEIIHVEVKKLYPEAELPSFKYEEVGEDELILYYSSSRPFADLAEGLIVGAMEHYGDDMALQTVDNSNGKNNSRVFKISKASS